jgi:hypothetical protein
MTHAPMLRNIPSKMTLKSGRIVNLLTSLRATRRDI